MRAFALLLVLCLLTLAPSAPVTAEGGTLAWSCPELTGLRFVRKSAASKNFSGPKFPADLILLRAHLTETGAPAMPLGAITEGDYALRLCCVVSGKAPGKPKEWKHEFDNTVSPGALASAPDIVDAAYSFTSAEGDTASWHVSAKGDDADATPALGNPRKTALVVEADVTFDLSKGWLTSIKGTWTWQDYGKPAAIEFEYALEGTQSFADRAALDKAVQGAIESGLQAIDGAETYWDNRADYAALAALSYLHGGRALSDPKLAAAIAKMEKPSSLITFLQTYHAGAKALAIEAKYISEAERKLVAQGKSPSEFKRTLTAADTKQMQEIVDWIAAKQEEQTRGLASYGQSPGQQVDLSNTQFAALALAAASRCGIEIPVGLVRDMGKAVQGFQQVEGPEVWRVKSRKKTGKWEFEQYADKARGFSYQMTLSVPPSPGAPTGSMTGAGTCTMLQVLDIYEAFTPERKKREMTAIEANDWLRAAQASANGGSAWLHLNYTVACNPAVMGETNYYYYMYALERVGAFTPTEFIGEHAWYEDGALTLLLRQDKEGSWGCFEDDCFALLFLSRATTPTRRVITGK